MTQNLIITYTRSGKNQAENVCRELNNLFLKRHNLLKQEIEQYKETGRFVNQCHLTSLKQKIENIEAQIGRNVGTNGLIQPMAPKYIEFASTEYKIEFNAVRGGKVFIITNPYEAVPLTVPKGYRHRNIPENDNELYHLMGGLNIDGSAYNVSVVSPYLSNARQDHREGKREITTLRTHLRLLTSVNIENLLIFDAHTVSITAMLNAHVDNLYASKRILQKLKEYFGEDLKDFVLCSPDAGGVKRTQKFNDALDLPRVRNEKERDNSKANTIKESKLYGDVKDKIVLVPDDIIDSGGTMKELIDNAIEKGAKGVVIIATHALFTKESHKMFDEYHKQGKLLKIYTTDSIEREPEFLDKYGEWFVQIPLAPIIATSIYAIIQEESMGRIHEEEDM